MWPDGHWERVQVLYDVTKFNDRGGVTAAAAVDLFWSSLSTKDDSFYKM